MSKLAIFGASGHGKVVADIALCTGWDEIFFYDDAWPNKERLEGWNVHGDFDALLSAVNLYDGAVVAIGNNDIREKVLELLEVAGFSLPSLIHPNAVVSQFATIERGCIVVAGGIVNAFSHLNRGCIVNTGATIGHDCVLDSCVHVAPGANVAGGVRIGSKSWVGIGSAIRQGIQLGGSTIVGAGAVVVKNVLANTTVVGTPARILE